MQRKSRLVAALTAGLAGLVLAGTVSATAARFGSDRASASLTLKAVLSLKSTIGGCPPGLAADDCAAREVAGPFPGLGQVAGTYPFLVDLGPPSCDAFSGRALAYSIRITVASKGEIELAVAESPCVDTESLRNNRRRSPSPAVRVSIKERASAAAR